jgi:hypothetical protein
MKERGREREREGEKRSEDICSSSISSIFFYPPLNCEPLL